MAGVHSKNRRAYPRAESVIYEIEPLPLYYQQHSGMVAITHELFNANIQLLVF